MIDIYLHTEFDPILPDLSPSMTRETLQKNLREASNLLEELKVIDDDENTYLVWKALVLIANRNVKDAQSGVTMLLQLKEKAKVAASKLLNTKLH